MAHMQYTLGQVKICAQVSTLSVVGRWTTQNIEEQKA